MMNSNESAKDRGVVVFAFNTAEVDYYKIAQQTTKLITHHLNLPVTLVTDIIGVSRSPLSSVKFDNVVYVEEGNQNFRNDTINGRLRQWRNYDRYLAYQNSPYYETLLIDTDYLVLDDSLLKIFETDFDYRLVHHNTTQDGNSYEQMGETGLPFVWATVMFFRKTPKSDLFFKLVGRIQRNYSYYRALFNIREGNFRNDYAFAIANIILNGYDANEKQGVPWKLFTLDKQIHSIANIGKFLSIRHGTTTTVIPRTQNVHIIDKVYLQSKDFRDFVKHVTT